MNTSQFLSFDLAATVRMSRTEGPALVRTERTFDKAPGTLRRRPAGTQPPPIAAANSPRVEPAKSAMEYAKEAHEELFAHRRGIWDCGDGVSCLFDNDAYAHRPVEIKMLRALLANAGCTVVGVATCPSQGNDNATHTLAVLVRGDAQKILSVYETVDRLLDSPRMPQAH